MNPADRPLGVGYVLKMFPRFSETFILNEILELERQGVKVAVFSMRAPNEPFRQPGVADVKARVRVIPSVWGPGLVTHVLDHLACLVREPGRYASTLGFVFRRGTFAAWKKFLVAPYIVRVARSEGIEHLHAHFASGPARQAKLASMLSGIPFSFTAHAKDLFWNGHQHGRNNKLKKRVRMAAFVVTISDFNRRFIQRQNFRVPRRRVVTIYNGMDLQRWPFTRLLGRPARPFLDGTPIILAVGRLVPKKGFDVLIRACQELRRDGVRFRCLIAGDGPEREHLDGLIEWFGLRGMVDLLGPVPQDELRERYHACASLLVQPSVVASDGDQDGIPTVIIEAMAVGLPVVASSLSGIDEIVVDGVSGLAVPPGDPGALAAALNRILTEPDLAATLARGGRQIIERRFDLRNNAKILVHLMTSSARGVQRWSNLKLRERMGLEPMPEDLREDEEQAPAEGAAFLAETGNDTRVGRRAAFNATTRR